MSDEMLTGWEKEASAMKRRDLSKDEKRVIGEEMLKGALKPDMDRRKRKNLLRRALDSVERAGAR